MNMKKKKHLRVLYITTALVNKRQTYTHIHRNTNRQTYTETVSNKKVRRKSMHNIMKPSQSEANHFQNAVQVGIILQTMDLKQQMTRGNKKTNKI